MRKKARILTRKNILHLFYQKKKWSFHIRIRLKVYHAERHLQIGAIFYDPTSSFPLAPHFYASIWIRNSDSLVSLENKLGTLKYGKQAKMGVMLGDTFTAFPMEKRRNKKTFEQTCWNKREEKVAQYFTQIMSVNRALSLV